MRGETKVRKVLYVLWQCTWGILQTLLGLIHFLVYLRCPHYWYHGAVVTQWSNKASVSLGLFVFVTDDLPYSDRVAHTMTRPQLARRLLVHEYGHTIQSLVLGPLYLLLIGVPSTVWGFAPSLNRKRREEQLSYFSFFTERWANAWGEVVTGEESMGQMVID